MRKIFLPLGAYLIVAGLMISPAQAQYKIGASFQLFYDSEESFSTKDSGLDAQSEVKNKDSFGYGFNFIFPFGLMLRLDSISNKNDWQTKEGSLNLTKVDANVPFAFSAGYRLDLYPYHIAATVGRGDAKVYFGPGLLPGKSLDGIAGIIHIEGGYALGSNFDVYLGIERIDIEGKFPRPIVDTFESEPLTEENKAAVADSNYDIGGISFSIGANFLVP